MCDEDAARRKTFGIVEQAIWFEIWSTACDDYYAYVVYIESEFIWV